MGRIIKSNIYLINLTQAVLQGLPNHSVPQLLSEGSEFWRL